MQLISRVWKTVSNLWEIIYDICFITCSPQLKVAQCCNPTHSYTLLLYANVRMNHQQIAWGSKCLSWWHHQMETFSALLAACAGNSPVTGEFPTKRPVTRSFDIFLDLHLNKRLGKQSWGWWFETLLRPLWRHCNEKETLAKIYSWYMSAFILWLVTSHFDAGARFIRVGRIQ